MPLIAVLYDHLDAGRFLVTRPPVDGVLTLTPRARAALGEVDIPVSSTSASFTDRDHARCVVHLRRARRALAAAFRHEPALGDAARLILGQAVDVLACQSARLWYTLTSRSTWLVPDGKGGWRACDSRTVAHEWLLQHMLGDCEKYGVDYRAPPAPRLFRALRDWSATLLRRSGRWIATGSVQLRFDLVSRLAAASPPVGQIIVRPATGGWQQYRSLLSATVGALRGRRTPVLLSSICRPVDSAQHRDCAAALARCLATLDDPIVRPAIDLASHALVSGTATYDGVEDDTARILRRVRPRHFMSFENNDAWAASAAAGAGKAGVQRMIINHNSLVDQESAAAREVVRGLFQRRIANPLADAIIAWSPYTAQLGRAMLPQEKLGSILPIVVSPDSRDATRESGAPFRLLHAGNYQNWIDTFPMINETSDEYVEGIAGLVAEIGSLPDFQLKIRVRAKLECDPATLRALLPAAENVEVVETQRPFLDELAECDLLIGFMSTTLEQALQLRKPVLLWGPTCRYMHLAASSTPPSQHSRAAVYVAHDRAALRLMLPAIRAAHRGKPLSMSELAMHVWPPDVPSLGQFVANVAADRLATDRL